MSEMKKPSKSVRKCAEKIQTEKSAMSSPAGSSMMTKFVRPSSGSRMMAAFTAFLKAQPSLQPLSSNQLINPESTTLTSAAFLTAHPSLQPLS